MSRHVIVVGDLHFGLRGANPIFEQEARRFCREVLIPEVDREKPLAVIFLGDLFDDRTRVHVRSSNMMQKEFAEPLEERGIETFYILGNHDTLVKDSLWPNSVEPLLRGYKHAHVITEPTDLTIGRMSAMLIPWITEDPVQAKSVIDAVEKTSATHLFGHLNLMGFEVTPGNVYTGVTPIAEHLDKFKLVVSGHFHLYSRRGNVLYAGSAHQHTRSDEEQLKRIWRLNVDDFSLQPVLNPSRLFHSVRIDGEEVNHTSYQAWKDDHAIELEDKIVTVIVADDVKDELVSRVVNYIEEIGAHDVRIADSRTSLDEIDAEEAAEIQSMSTEDILYKYIDDPSRDFGDLDRSRLKELVADIVAEVRGMTRTEFE